MPRFAISASVRAVAVVNGALVHVAETFRFVLPLAAVVGAVADTIHIDAKTSSAVEFNVRLASGRSCSSFSRVDKIFALL